MYANSQSPDKKSGYLQFKGISRFFGFEIWYALFNDAEIFLKFLFIISKMQNTVEDYFRNPSNTATSCKCGIKLSESRIVRYL